MQKIMFQTLVLQRAFFYFLHPVYIVIPAAYDAHYCFSFYFICKII